MTVDTTQSQLGINKHLNVRDQLLIVGTFIRVKGET